MNPTYAYAPHAADHHAASRAMSTETIDQRCFRLGLRAADKDAEAERHWKAEADAAGMAARRRLKWGADDTTAIIFDHKANACRVCALDAEAEAARLRSQAASLRRAQRYADGVIGSLAGRVA